MARTLARMNRMARSVTRMARTLARMTRMARTVTRKARWLAHFLRRPRCCENLFGRLEPIFFVFEKMAE